MTHSNFLNLIPDQEIHSLLQGIYSDFEYLHFFRDYGTYCVAITQLLCNALERKGYQARPIVCIDEVEKHQQQFYLGAPGFAKPGQLEGHVVCLLEERYLIDFGLGNVRRYFDIDFLHAIAVECNINLAIYASLNIGHEKRITWHMSTHENINKKTFEDEAQHLTHAFQLYFNYTKNRIAYSIQQQMRSKSNRSITQLDATLA
jgi:hypothetical protein